MKTKDDEEGTCFRTAEHAWLTYRTAHIALFKAVCGPAHGPAQVELDTALAMTTERTQELLRP